ncbi:unnamed protein product, partial [Timema podura]|nr:unnamed protein product [Timema podura]
GTYLVFDDGDIDQPKVEAREWERNRFHFDDVAKAMLTLFTVSTFEGWPGRNCIEFALKAKPVRRYIPKHRIQYKVWWFVTSQPFEYTIFVLIMLNTITLAMKFHKQPDYYNNFLDTLNIVFTTVFAMEFVFKLAAFRFKVRIFLLLLVII